MHLSPPPIEQVSTVSVEPTAVTAYMTQLTKHMATVQSQLIATNSGQPHHGKSYVRGEGGGRGRSFGCG